MTGVLAILAWWILFGATHVFGSSVPVRTFVSDRVGVPAFKGVYTLVALATFVPLVYVYFHNKHAGAQLFAPSSAAMHVTELLMVLAFVVLLQGLATPNPMSTAAELSGQAGAGARGIQRVTRHPMNFAFVLFGFAHCLSNPFVGDWVFFGGFVVYGIVSAVHQDARTRATRPDAVKAFQDETSLVPFAAILRGKQRLALGEYGRIPLVVGIVLALAIRVFHGALFGGFGGA